MSDTNRPGDLIRTDTVAAVRNHPNDHEPFFQGDRRILKDGPNLRGELAFRMNGLALPFALVVKENNVVAPTSGADHDAIRPAKQGHVGKSVVRVGIEHDRILQGLWLLVFAVHVGKVLHES